METVKKVLLGAALVLLFVSAFAFTPPATLQGEPIKDTRIVNTTAEAVPTRLVGTSNISGQVSAQQSGPWTVGISGTPDVSILGTPTFRIDPAHNTVKVSGGGTRLVLNQDFNGLPADTDNHIDALDISPFAKIRLSGTVNGSGDVTYRIYSGPVVGGPHTGLKRLDSFTSGSSFTKVYEVAGLALHITINPSDSNNQSILTVYGH